MATDEQNEGLAAGAPAGEIQAAVDQAAVDQAGREQGSLDKEEAAPRRRPTPEETPAAIEALLFASERALDVRALCLLLGRMPADEVRKALGGLVEFYGQAGRGVRIVEVAGGYQMRTAPEHADFVRRLFNERPTRLSRASLETLSIVAYRQPITRTEIEEIRRVDSGGVLRLLLDRRFVRILGKKDEPGRPLLYGTTKEFLEFFGLKDLSSLPTLKEFTELSEEFRALVEQKAGVAAVGPFGPPAGDGEEGVVEEADAEVAALAADSALQAAPVELPRDPEADKALDELDEALAHVDQKRKEVAAAVGLTQGPEETSETTGAAPPPEGEDADDGDEGGLGGTS